MSRKRTHSTLDRLGSDRLAAKVALNIEQIAFLKEYTFHYSVVKSHGKMSHPISTSFIKRIDDLLDAESIAALQMVAEGKAVGEIEDQLQWPARSARIVFFVITNLCIKHELHLVQ